MSIKEDNIESNDSFDKFINNLTKFFYNFLEQLKNYYQAYLSTVLTANLKESLYHEHKKVESNYNNLKDRLIEFLTVITRDSAEIKQKFNEIKLLRQNYEFYKNLLEKISNNRNDMEDNIISEYEQIEGKLNELVSIHRNKMVKLNNFKFYLKDGIIEYQSYSDQQSFSIPIKSLIKNLKKIIQNIGVDKELKKDYSTLKKSLHEIQSLSSYPDFIPSQSIEDTLTDAGSLHVTPKTKKRKEHPTMVESGPKELAIDTQNAKIRKKSSDFNDDLLVSNSRDEQVAVQSAKTSSYFGDQAQDVVKNLLEKKLLKKERNKRNGEGIKVSSTRFVLESIMPDGVPSLMDIDAQDIISKEYYETTLQILEEKLKHVDEIDNYLIIHENDKLCKQYHKLKEELDQLEEDLDKTKKQIGHIEKVRKISGDNSTNIQKNQDKENEKLNEIEHKIINKKSEIKRIQKLIRKLDKNDYDLQNYKHILYNGMRKLFKHWLLQVQNDLDQEIDVERQTELQDDIEKAREKMRFINADINDMYLSYNKRKKSRMLTDFDYEHFCEYSTFTECLYRYDTSFKSDDNDNTNSMVVIEKYTP